MKKFNDLNRLVYILSSADDHFKKNVIKFFEIQLLGGITTNFNALFDLASNLDLIEVSEIEDRVHLTDIGKELYKKRNSNCYELNDKQKELLSFRYLNFQQEFAYLLFSHSDKFEDNFLIFEGRISKFISQLFNEFRELNIILKRKGKFVVEKKYWSKFRSKPQTEERLIENLKKQKKAGEKAEILALLYEYKRLRKLGEKKVFLKIKYISKEKVNAGFDITSINGLPYEGLSLNDIIYDRFIEVKNVSNGIFYLSSNEFKIAKITQDHYWLYLIDFKNHKINFIQNPIRFFKDNKIKGDSVNWRYNMNDLRLIAQSFEINK